MRIIGIDPGYERLGIAVLEKNSGASSKKEVLLHSECFQTSSKLPMEDRLHLVGRRLEEIIETYSPEALVLETLFFSNNQKTALKVAETRGVIQYQAKRQNLEVFEFSPQQVKIAVTGYGASDKIHMTKMIHQLVIIDKEISKDDEYDAIAVGLTYFAHNIKLSHI